jgi:hypothetical protein
MTRIHTDRAGGRCDALREFGIVSPRGTVRKASIADDIGCMARSGNPEWLALGLRSLTETPR